MTLPPLQLILILTCTLTTLFFLFGWWFVFRRSPLMMFLTVLGMMIRREKPLAPADTFVQPKGTRLKDAMVDSNDDYTFEQAMQKVRGENPVQAQSAQVDAPMSAHLTTSDIGYPRPLSESEIDSPRPFLKIQVDTEKDNQQNGF